MKRLALAANQFAVAAASFLCVLTNSANAGTANYFGHQISIEQKDDGLKALLVDGKKIDEDSYVQVEKSASMSGAGIVVVSLFSGMSGCSDRKLLISFAKDKPLQTAAHDDEDCREIDYEIGKYRVIFTIDARPLQDGLRWTWTPGGGLTAPEKVAFQPDPRKNWANLPSQQVNRPAELFNFADIGAQLHGLIGNDFREAIEIIDGTGYGGKKGEMYVGWSFRQHMGDSTGSVVIADFRSHRVFVAWKAENKKIIVRPEVAQWPHAARAELKTWAEPWYQDGRDSAATVAEDHQPQAAAAPAAQTTLPATLQTPASVATPALANVSRAVTLESYETILAKEREGLKAIAALDVATLPATEAKQRLQAIAAKLDQDVGFVPSSSDDPRLHDIYVTGARGGISKAFDAIRLWEGAEVAKLAADPRRLQAEYPKLHALKVLEFKDIEASLLRDDIERFVNNPNLSAAEIRQLARRALTDDGQQLNG